MSLETYKLKLKEAELLPSRRLLKDKLDERFGCFKKYGIENVLGLQKALKKKSTFAGFANEDFFDEEYLAILLREINSIHPKPNKIVDFPGISKDTAEKLLKIGIKDTLGLYGYVMAPVHRKELSAKTGIGEAEITELTKLCDLSRIKWAGAMFARVLYEAGYDTAEKVSKADFVELHKLITRLNKEKGLYKGNIGANDIKLCINAAKEIPYEIEY